MKILVSGGTGFIGSHLIPALLMNQNQITVIGRDAKKTKNIFKESISSLSWNQINEISPDEFDAIINLAGENIAQHRWTENSKKSIKESRLASTRQLVNWVLPSKNKKLHLYNASAIGIYPLQKSTSGLPTALTESSPIDFGQQQSFLSEVGESWENETKPLIEAKFPVTLMRFAVVLKRSQGILKKLELPFSLGLGTILGNGQQAFSWISIDDLVSAILFLINRPEIIGPVNCSAPECVSQQVFAQTLSDIMHRPLFLKLPSQFVKVLFGQMGEELLLGGQNVFPERLKQLGFEFLYPDLHSALLHEWHPNKTEE